MFRAATLQIKVAGSIETLVLVYNTMWFNFPEECILTHYLFGSNVTHLLLMFCVHTSGLHARKRYQNVCLSSRLQVNAAALNPEILESQKLRITVERKPSTGPVRFKTTNNHQDGCLSKRPNYNISHSECHVVTLVTILVCSAFQDIHFRWLRSLGGTLV